MVRLLIADDEDLVRRGLTALIEREAPEVEIVGAAVDGREALELALRHRPDVVLTDIRMPDLNGLDLVERLRAAQPGIHCIILSGYDEFDYARRAIGLGVADYLLKPVDPDDLLGLLRRTEEKIVAARRDEMARVQAGRLAAGHTLLRLLNGHEAPADTGIPAARGWSLLLIRVASPHIAAESDDALAALCLQAIPDAVAVEDAYGYLCVLAPLCEVSTAEAAAVAECLHRRLHDAGWTAAVTAARPCASLGVVNAAHHDAIEAAEYHDMGRLTEPLLAWTVLPRRGEHWPTVPVARRDALLDAVARGDEAAAVREAHALLAHALERMAPGALRTLWFEIVVLVIHHVQQFGVRADALLGPEQSLRAFLVGTVDPGAIDYQLSDLAAHAARECRALQESNAPRGAIANLRRYIETHPGADLTITHLAQRLHLNAKYLGDLFKQTTGEPLGEFIIRTRMRRACELLTHAPLKVYAVAEQVGYSNPKHFATMFRSVVGVSPAEYRERHRQLSLDAIEDQAPCAT